MATRLLAFVAAMAMVAGALAVRSRLEEGGGGQGRRALRLVCSSELAEACAELGEAEVSVAVEPAGATAERLGGVVGDPGLDGWLVPEPWPELVEQERRASGLEPLFGPVTGPVARSPLVIVVWRDRADALRRSCAGGVVGWRCLGDAAPKDWSAVGGQPQWGPVKPAHASPSTEAVGLSVVGAAASAFFDNRTDFDRFDLDQDDFRGWFTGLERAVRRSGSDPLGTMLRTPAQIDAVGTVEAEAGPAVAAAAAKPLVLYPEPVVTVDVVLAVARVRSADRVERSVERSAAGALARAGWRVEGQSRAPGVGAGPPLPPTSGLPPAGVLAALREVHEEVIR